MNKCLTAQQTAVQKYGGMVDKYIGDAMMAIFNAPLDLDKHEKKALLCALEIQNNMRVLNKDLQKKGINPVQIGLGINTGYAVVGNMGSETRFDYTAIGDAVNVAARLESGTKGVGVDLLIGESTQNALEFDLIPLEPIEAKGKKDKLQVYTWN
jgi:adenylate cyclase